uniref:Uncharacterized protein n=1 Tax=Cacopsylla melanoneura TaxID=428564 RepID=A0A8D8WSV0_9HEMI
MSECIRGRNHTCVRCVRRLSTRGSFYGNISAPTTPAPSPRVRPTSSAKSAARSWVRVPSCVNTWCGIRTTTRRRTGSCRPCRGSTRDGGNCCRTKAMVSRTPMTKKTPPRPNLTPPLPNPPYPGYHPVNPPPSTIESFSSGR